jgi:hypothetical protein
MSAYMYTAGNPVMLVDPDGNDIVYMGEGGNEVNRIKNDKVNKTYVVDINAKSVAISGLGENGADGWKEAKMPGVIPNKDGANTTGDKYQKYDYLIAAETSYFNQYKNSGVTPNHTNGQSIDNPNSVPDLDPNIVKAMIMQESSMGTYDRNPKDKNNSYRDIMQANVWYSSNSNDWNDSKKQFGLEKAGGANPSQSVRAGIGILFQKGLSTNGGKTTFRGWNSAVDRYNGGGVPNYGDKVRKMANSARKI